MLSSAHEHRALPEAEGAPTPKNRLRRVPRIALRVYLIFCGVLVACLAGLIVFLYLRGPSAAFLRARDERSLLYAYGAYMADEHPKRGERFGSVAATLDQFRQWGGAVDRKVLLKFLGVPDLVHGEPGDSQLLAYLCESPKQDKPVVLVSVRGDEVIAIAFTGYSVNDMSGFKPYSPSETPKKPKADGRTAGPRDRSPRPAK